MSKEQRVGRSDDPKGERRRTPPKAGRKPGRPSQGRYQATTKPTPKPKQARSRTAVGAGADLPKWLREEIVRTTKKDRRDATLNLLSAAAGSFEEGRYPAARKKLLEAKQLSSRAGAIRELLALSSYRMGLWEEALREIRAFRRITGDTTHLAVEMDALRALGREDGVEKTWQLFEELGGSRPAESELRVVYASFHLDQGDPRRAWEVSRPRRLTKEAAEWEIRLWYVAARAAARLGDKETARQIATAIEELDPAMPGLEDLHAEIA